MHSESRNFEFFWCLQRSLAISLNSF